MKNWSGHIKWYPNEVHKPSTSLEVVQIIKQARHQERNIRTIGSGHSFMPLSKTEDVLVSLDNYQGFVAIDNNLQQVTVKAGTKLSLLNKILDEHNLACANMGDIDAQSIAGAISTGTHGTGIGFGNMSTQVTKIKFVNGKGEVHDVTQDINFELFKSLQVSLGTLGVITEVTIQCIPKFTLALEVERLLLDDVLSNLEHLNKDNRNFEFYWFPNTPYVMTKKCNTSTLPEESMSRSEYFHEIVLENYGFKLGLELSKLIPSWTNKLSNISAKSISGLKKTRASYQVFSTPRMIRFNEMEYNIPAAAYQDVIKDITHWVNRNNKDILFPLENRFVQGDDIYLSPAYNRDSAYIAAHVYHKKDYKSYFKGLEEIFSAYNGRPHWGKINTLTSEDFRALYPQFEKFNSIRYEHDPDGMFLSPYLKTIFLKQPTAARTA